MLPIPPFTFEPEKSVDQPWPRLLHKSLALPSSSPKRRCKHTALRAVAIPPQASDELSSVAISDFPGDT